jgi:flagellar biosynthetic protein FliR
MEMDFINWMLVFVRMGAFLLLLPFFSAVNFPVMLRVALAGLGAVLLTPLLPPFTLQGLDLIGWILVLAKELAVGLLLGFIGRMVFYAVDLGGSIITTEMGLNLAPIYNPMSSTQTTAPGTALFLLASVVMLTLDLHHWMLMGFQQTYVLLPVGKAALSNVLFSTVISHTAHIFWVAVQMASPLIAVSFVVTMVFSILSRAVPQMNVFSESFAFRAIGGMAVFGLTLQIMAQHIVNGLRRIPDDLARIAQLLGGGGGV